MTKTLKFVRRNLPHWIVADRSYFVTVRLDGSLPAEVVKQLQYERECLNPDDELALDQLKRKQFQKLEACLDQAKFSSDWLKQPDVADLVFDNFCWFLLYQSPKQNHF